MVTIKCSSCGHENDFEQPYQFHAGFANQGFLYNDQGNLTLVWSSFDDAYKAIMGRKHPWMLATEEQALFEDALHPAPSGGRWRFINPARCMKCASPISGPITETIYYLCYPGSIIADLGPTERHLREFLSPPNPDR
jgi:hypothetical protein